jgi:hypothetical protein
VYEEVEELLHTLLISGLFYAHVIQYSPHQVECDAKEQNKRRHDSNVKEG